MEARPRFSRMDILDMMWPMAWPTARPEYLAKFKPILLNLAAAVVSQTSRDSATKGMKGMFFCPCPCQFPFVGHHHSGIFGDCGILHGVGHRHVESCLTPAHLFGQDHIGRLAGASFMGLRLAEAVVSWIASLRSLCLQILSPPAPQTRAPSTSLGFEQAGQRPALSNTVIPSLNLIAMMKSWLLTESPQVQSRVV